MYTKIKSIIYINVKDKIPSSKDSLSLEEAVRIQIQSGSDILVKVMYQDV
jgi:hypothetical protein